MAGNDKGTAGSIAQAPKKGQYKHPDFPDRSLERLQRDANAFDVDANLVSLAQEEPFYADIIRSFHKEATLGITTAGVLYFQNIMRLWFNPLFMGAYELKIVRGILKHEALHLALEHTTTRRYEPHKIWNIGTDLAINSSLPKDEVPPCGFLPGRKFRIPPDFGKWKPDVQKRYLALSALVEGMPPELASEEYFTLLMNSDVVKEMLENSKGKKKKKGESGNGGAPGSEGGDGEEEGEGGGGDEEGDEEGEIPDGQDDHDGWDELSDEEREYVASKIREVVKGAQERADNHNKWGTVPASMREEIRKKVRGEIDWKAVLRHFVGTTSRADRISSVYRMNRKYAGIHPGHSRDHRPTINCYVDQSGSMSDDDIMLCFGELANLAHRVDIVVYHFDTEVDETSRTVWKKGNSIPKALRTRCGGTDFEAATRHAAASKAEAYIILTDGGAPKPSRSRIRRCWVLVPGQQLYFGDTDPGDIVVKMKRPLITQK
jgi:predicted metal-dependent peptidase